MLEVWIIGISIAWELQSMIDHDTNWSYFKEKENMKAYRSNNTTICRRENEFDKAESADDFSFMWFIEVQNWNRNKEELFLYSLNGIFISSTGRERKEKNERNTFASDKNVLIGKEIFHAISVHMIIRKRKMGRNMCFVWTDDYQSNFFFWGQTTIEACWRKIISCWLTWSSKDVYCSFEVYWKSFRSFPILFDGEQSIKPGIARMNLEECENIFSL